MFEDIKTFFKSLIEKFKNRNKRISPFVISLCALLIVIPTILAVYYAYFYEDPSYLATNKVQVNLYSNDGRLLASEEVAEANASELNLAGILRGISENKIKAIKPSELQNKNFEFSIKQKDSYEQYICYFTSSHEDSYIEDKEGTYYKIEENSFNAFLNSQYSEALYAHAKAPQLVTGNGEPVIPLSVNWNYRKQDKSFSKSKDLSITSEQKTYTISGSVNLAFDIAPDTSNITLYNINGGEIYNGPLEDVSYVVIQAGSQIRAKLSAVWKNSDDTDIYGDITYDFNIILKNRASFNISNSNVAEGEFIVLSATNVDDTSKILFSVEYAGGEENTPAEKSVLEEILTFKPIFVKDGGIVRTIMPFPIDSPAGTYRIFAAFGVTEQIFTVNLQKRSVSTAVLNASSHDILARISKKALNSLNNTLKSIKVSSAPTVLCRDEFLLPEELGFVAGYSFNDSVTPMLENVSFVSKGNEYLATLSGGQSVVALNIGTVAAVGDCEYLGKYIAIDHGMGLITWYCGLDSINASIGDTVAKGEKIGVCGSQGLLSSSGVLILCSVYETLIDPSAVLGNNIIASKS